MSTKTNLILIGMSGAGKSTLGVLIAKTLGISFIDTDILLQRQEGKLLQPLLDECGPEEFIRREEKTILSLDVTHTVIATGGSVIYSDRSMQHLSSLGTIIYLSVPYPELQNRLHNISTRGIVFRHATTLYDVYRERLPLYEKYADLTVDITSAPLEINAGRVTDAYLSLLQKESC